MIWHAFFAWWVGPLCQWWADRQYRKIPAEYWVEQDRKWAAQRAERTEIEVVDTTDELADRRAEYEARLQAHMAHLRNTVTTHDC